MPASSVERQISEENLENQKAGPQLCRGGSKHIVLLTAAQKGKYATRSSAVSKDPASVKGFVIQVN